MYSEAFYGNRIIAGYKLHLTCGACPEQYDVYKDGKQVAYFRLRHGRFTVTCPDVGGDMVYEAYPMGDGIFEDQERLYYLTAAIVEVDNYYKGFEPGTQWDAVKRT